LVLLGRAKFGTGSTRDNLLVGNAAANVLSGLEGNDVLAGEGGGDTLYGNEGRDTLRGGDGSDQLFGQQGDDRMLGDRGSDRLSGEDGRDILTGYGGSNNERDELVGGEGADIFVIGTRNQGIFYLGNGYATIVDFQRSQQDNIQVAGKVKNYSIVTNRNFVGSAASDAAIFRNGDLIAVVQDNIGITYRNLVVA
jgi:Ca2+-binding RTX toxin-like protein